MTRPADRQTPSAGTAADGVDAALVERIAAGDRGALGSLYDRHGGLLLGVAMDIERNRAEAEDIVHDVFLEVWKRADTYDPARGTVRRWLLVRLRSRMLDRLKSHAWSRRSAAERDDRSWSPDPAVALDGARVLVLLRELSPEQRAVVAASYFDGLSSSEIAARLEIPLGTVKSRMAAAMQRLRALLGAAS